MPTPGATPSWLQQPPKKRQPQGPALLGGAAQDTAPDAPVWQPPGMTWGGWAQPGASKHAATAGGGARTAHTDRIPGWGMSAAGGGQQPGGVLSTPGTGEQAYAEHGGQFFAPNALDDWWKTHASAFDAPTNTEQFYSSVAGRAAPQVSNRADEAYQKYVENMPGMLDAPDLGAYYQNAETRAQNSLSKAQAARGVYGSSVAAGQAGDVSAQLNAERANREADYNLARNADYRSTLEGLSGAGRAADVSSLGGASLDLSHMQSLGELAGLADRLGSGRLGMGAEVAGSVASGVLSQLVNGINAAFGAQDQTQGRERGQLQDLIGLYGILSGLGMGTYGAGIGADAGLLDAQISGPIAGASSSSADTSNRREGLVGDTAALIDALRSGGSGGGSGGGGLSPEQLAKLKEALG